MIKLIVDLMKLNKRKIAQLGATCNEWILNVNPLTVERRALKRGIFMTRAQSKEFLIGAQDLISLILKTRWLSSLVDIHVIPEGDTRVQD